MKTITHSNIADTISKTEPPKPGCLFYVGRGLKWLGIVLVTLIILGVAYQTIATEIDNRNFSPRGQLYTVNGHQMHLYCAGESSPTIILDAGAVALWAWIQPTVAQSTRVCAYDRAGYGWSEPGAEPRDAQHIAAELHALLNAAGIEPPYVMAGHSFGGVYVRVYNAQYPGEVEGMVLVDATHPDTWERQGQSIETLQAMADVSAVLSRVGLMRLYAAGQRFDLPEPDSAALKANMASSQYWDSQRADTAAMLASLEQGRTTGNLGDLPLAVLTAVDYPEGQGRDTERALQLELAALSSNSLYQEIAGARHITLLTDEQHAQQVSNAILDVLVAAQTGEPPAAF
jgi:pimeloyl-ACP methyl ester carboxylesterase